MENTLVSIILPTRNREDYIERAIKSVFSQTYKNIELIVVNDKSSDGTSRIVSKIAKGNNKIAILNNETNLGLVKSLNRGIKASKGIYIARLDDDDFWCDDKKIEKQVNFLEKNKDFGLVGGGMIKVNKHGKDMGRYLFPEKDEDIRKVILLYNPFVHTSVLFRKSVFDDAGEYDEHFIFFEDWDLWLRIGKISKFYNFQEYFVCYLDHEYDNPLHYRNLGIRRNIKISIELLKKYRKDYYGFYKSFLLCFARYFYSYFPYRKEVWPLFFKLSILIFGRPLYKYSKKICKNEDKCC